jgi:hypothetical protein
MSFFESFAVPDPAPPLRPPRPAWARPDAVIPGSVPAELILVRTVETAVAVGSVRAYPNGFEFTSVPSPCGPMSPIRSSPWQQQRRACRGTSAPRRPGR